MNQSFEDILIELYGRKRGSLTDLKKEIGVTLESVRRWVSGGSIDEKNLKKIAQALKRIRPVKTEKQIAAEILAAIKNSKNKGGNLTLEDRLQGLEETVETLKLKLEKIRTQARTAGWPDDLDEMISQVDRNGIWHPVSKITLLAGGKKTGKEIPSREGKRSDAVQIRHKEGEQ